MAAAYATIEDLEILWRPLKQNERDRAIRLLDLVSDELRVQAEKADKNLDKIIEEKPYFSSTVKSVTIDVVARTLLTSTEAEPMTQESQSALGYSWSGTYLVPGGGLFIKKSELARLGLKRQILRGIEMYGD